MLYTVKCLYIIPKGITIMHRNRLTIKRIFFFIFTFLAFSVNSQLQSDNKFSSPYTVNSLNDASRFLKQAAFGGGIDEINAVKNYDDYIEKQFNLPITYLYPKIDPQSENSANWLENTNGNVTNIKNSWTEKDLTNLWWHTIINSKDQLRQRVAHALSQIFVVGKVKELGKTDYIRISYYDLLIKNSFGNFRDLLTDVTMSPIMASYLTMINNNKANDKLGTHPDENYAREIMQLFTIGLEKLNVNGTKKLDEYGKPIPTYSQNDIEGMAKIFTGLTYSKEEQYRNYDVIKKPEIFEIRFGTRNEHYVGVYTVPMQCMQKYHDSDEKYIFDGIIIPPNQTCLSDVNMALDALFNHETLPPFFSKQMIQKFVTSNPSKEYINRVANIFIDNGFGVRGDMKSIIRAILLDKEARAPAKTYLYFGKFKEPIIRSITFAKIFNVSANVEYPTTNPFPNGGQLFFKAPSVFNYFSPDFTAGEDLTNLGLTVPELEISSASNITNINNGYYWLIFNSNFLKDLPATASKLQNRYYINLSYELTLAKRSTDELLEHLNTLLLDGTMNNNYKKTLKTYIEDELIIKPSHNTEKIEQIFKTRVHHAIYIIMTSSTQKFLH